MHSQTVIIHMASGLRMLTVGCDQIISISQRRMSVCMKFHADPLCTGWSQNHHVFALVVCSGAAASYGPNISLLLCLQLELFSFMDQNTSTVQQLQDLLANGRVSTIDFQQPGPDGSGETCWRGHLVVDIVFTSTLVVMFATVVTVADAQT